MDRDRLQGLAETFAGEAMKAAVSYLEVNNLRANRDILVACLRSWSRIKMPEALRDSRAALSADMPHLAEAKFIARMREIGVAAAKEAVQLR